jgi:hypothetical protein
MSEKAQTWQDKVKEYCELYNIPLFYLTDTLSDPKVVPMVRGKSFEFSVLERLAEILPQDTWLVDKPFMNAQSGLHDIDIRVQHKETQKSIGLECKLSAKGRFRNDANRIMVQVKCMRSRTLGKSKVAALAPRLGIDARQLLVHNDQYLPANFDYVVTSLANAFYHTDPETKVYTWSPTQAGEEFLRALARPGGDDLQNFAFNKMYIAHSNSLVISPDNSTRCTRRKCATPKRCGFIPNYPIIEFDPHTLKPLGPWHELENASEIFLSFIQR